MLSDSGNLNLILVIALSQASAIRSRLMATLKSYFEIILRHSFAGSSHQRSPFDT